MLSEAVTGAKAKATAQSKHPYRTSTPEVTVMLSGAVT
jgi:hypothetical protein